MTLKFSRISVKAKYIEKNTYTVSDWHGCSWAKTDWANHSECVWAKTDWTNSKSVQLGKSK